MLSEPLFGSNGWKIRSELQWIFPDLKFTCYGVVTKWIFKAQKRMKSWGCTVWLSTWRLSRTADVYDRVKKTDISRAGLVEQNGAVLTDTYKVATRIQVQREDIFGIEIECPSSINLFNSVSMNVLGIRNNSRSVDSLSYWRAGPGIGSQISTKSSSTNPEWNYFPIVKPVIGELTAN